MSTPYTFENFLRVHDDAVYNWFDSLLVDYGDIAGAPQNGVPILRVMETPDRTFAKSVNILQARGFIPPELEEEQNIKQTERSYEIPPLPLVNFVRSDPVPELELAGVPKDLHIKFMNPATGQWESHRWPAFYRADYQCTFWSSKVYTDVFMREWVYGQIGKKGLADNELLLPVVHDAPWGTKLQSFKMTGMTDASDYEGSDQRYKRFEATFSLRMLMFKVKNPSVYPVDRIGIDSGEVLKDVNGEPTTIDLDSVGAVDTVSSNLFPYPLTDYKLGNMTVTGTGIISRGVAVPRDENKPSLDSAVRVSLTGSTDSAELTRWFLTIPENDTRIVNVYGVAQTNAPIAADVKASTILSVSFRYRASIASVLTVNQVDPTTGVVTVAYALPLPAQTKWKRVHVFVLLYQTIFNVVLRGVGSNPTGTVDLYSVQIRNLNSDASPVTIPSSTIDNSTELQYQWLPLSSIPVLVFGKVVSTAGPVQFTLQNDIVSPSFSAVQTIDSTVNKGVVGLTQPLAGSIMARVPEGTSLLYLVMQPYPWSFNGHEI